jgi:hypothetical protein
MNKTTKAFLNDGNPTDLPMRLGILNFGEYLESVAKGGEVDSVARTVATDVHAFVDSSGVAQQGIVLSVRVSAGGVTGPFSIIESGTPATTQVKVTMSAGQPTLTFAAADAVTACFCRWIKVPYTRDGVTWVAKLAESVG